MRLRIPAVALLLAAPVTGAVLVETSRDSGQGEVSPAPTSREAPFRPGRMPAVPPRWGSRLHLGIANDGGKAADVAGYGSLRLRYQYLSGGVNTGKGWRTWGSGDGRFVSDYIGESQSRGLRSVFSYYQLFQSDPQPGGRTEGEAVVSKLRNRATMRAYYADLAAFFRAAQRTGSSDVILHVEPDVWGYAQQRSKADSPATIPVAVRSTGVRALQRLPNDLRGFAQGIVRLRDRLAPQVQLAYALSIFGTRKDINLSHPSFAETDVLARRSARFYRRLRAPFNLVFGEIANRDSGYALVVGRDRGSARWTHRVFNRHVHYLRTFTRQSGERVVLWQIPFGNSVMRAMDNTPGHYQDNRVEWLLGGGPGRDHLRAYADAGVVGLLFGRALPDTTCACDARNDGITNPPPIGGDNIRPSVNADDDGGYFRERTREYYRAGAVKLPRR